MRLYVHEELNWSSGKGEVHASRGAHLELPPSTGKLLLAAHSDTVCDVTDEEDPQHHTCEVTLAQNEMRKRDRMMRTWVKRVI